MRGLSSVLKVVTQILFIRSVKAARACSEHDNELLFQERVCCSSNSFSTTTLLQALGLRYYPRILSSRRNAFEALNDSIVLQS